MIKLQIIGYLGADAIVKQINDRYVIEFNVAHTERFKGADGIQRERTIWVRCSYWRNKEQLKVAEYLKKGKQVYVEGIPGTSAYINQEGNAVGRMECRVTRLELLGGGTRTAMEGFTTPEPQQKFEVPEEPPISEVPEPGPAVPPSEEGDDEDDLPF